MSALSEANVIFRKRVTGMVKQINDLSGYRLISVRKERDIVKTRTNRWYIITVDGVKRSSTLTIQSTAILLEGFLKGMEVGCIRYEQELDRQERANRLRT